MSDATKRRMRAKLKAKEDEKNRLLAQAKADRVAKNKTEQEEKLGRSIQEDLITPLSPTELKQWVDEYQTHVLEISKRKAPLQEAYDELSAKINKKNKKTIQNKKNKTKRKAKKNNVISVTGSSSSSSPTPLQSVPQQQTIPSQSPTMFFNTDPQINPYIFTDITAPTVKVPISNIVLVSAPSGFLESVTNEQLYDSFEKISKPGQGESLDPLYLIQRQSRDRVLIAFKHHLLAQHLLTKCGKGCSITLNGHDIKFRVMPWSQTVEHQTYINSATQLPHRGGRRTRKHIKRHRKKTRKHKRKKTKRKRKKKRRKRTKRR